MLYIYTTLWPHLSAEELQNKQIWMIYIVSARILSLLGINRVSAFRSNLLFIPRAVVITVLLLFRSSLLFNHRELHVTARVSVGPSAPVGHFDPMAALVLRCCHVGVM